METGQEFEQPTEFKNLGEYYSYTDSMPDLPADGPDPRNYTVEDEDRFEKDLADHRQKLAIKEGVAQGIKEVQPKPQGPPPLTPWPDDPHGAERAELKAHIQDYEAKAIAARERGETRPGFTAADYQQRAAMEYKRLQALPPEPQAEFMEEQQRQAAEGAADLTTNSNNENHPFFKHERVKHDAPIAIARANRVSKTKLRLPAEDSPYGNLNECSPENMIVFDNLPKEVLASIQKEVAISGCQSANEELRTTWRILRQQGYASSGKRVVEPKPKGA